MIVVCLKLNPEAGRVVMDINSRYQPATSISYVIEILNCRRVVKWKYIFVNCLEAAESLLKLLNIAQVDHELYLSRDIILHRIWPWVPLCSQYKYAMTRSLGLMVSWHTRLYYWLLLFKMIRRCCCFDFLMFDTWFACFSLSVMKIGIGSKRDYSCGIWISSL